MGPRAVTNFEDHEETDCGLFACSYPLGSGLTLAPTGGQRRLWEVHVRMADSGL